MTRDKQMVIRLPEDALVDFRLFVVTHGGEIMTEKALSDPQEVAAIRHMIGAKPRLNKGVHGKKYDNYTCGECGFVLQITDNYCPNCGTRCLWDSPKCLTGR